MIKFEHTEVFNFAGAIRGMRNSWGSWEKSDSKTVDGKFILGDADRKLAMKLSKAGSDHAKYLRQIFVSADIIAPLNWWKQADQYKVGTVTNSTSTMHTITRQPFRPEMFAMDRVAFESRVMFYRLLSDLEELRELYLKTKRKEYWRSIIALLPDSFLQKRTWSGNYQVLKSMYHARKHHKLVEWHDFCEWVETLPYSELITLKETE